MMMLKFGIVLFISSFCFPQVAESETDNPCNTMETCGKCIQSHPDCAWCSQEDFGSRDGNRCDYVSNLSRRRCEDHNIVSPQIRIEKRKDAPLSDRNSLEPDVVQMKPQEIKLALRPRLNFSFDVEFHQMEDFPIDIYFLVDMSSSMKDHKEKLEELGNMLPEDIQKITTNYRLGIGSFMGKNHDNPQQVPYEFQNHMRLGLETNTFSHMVRELRVPENQNASGSGFLAIMQAISCKWVTGWRARSRKIILFVSDSVPFYAGDGKAHRVGTPNDGYCHLDDNGRMEYSLQDYPSLTQINQKIRRNEINIIFAVTERQVPYYQRISEQLEGSAVVRLEDGGFSDYVREIYDSMTTSVQMLDVSPYPVQVTYFSRCLRCGEERETSTCSGLRVGDSVTFRVNVQVTTCPENREEWIQTFRIYPRGIMEQLLVNLEMICECECETPMRREEDSPRCPGSKTYECGVCKDTFQCDGIHVDDKYCYPYDVVDGLPCSGRGTCICGSCDCDQRNNPEERISGYFCECDNFSCDRLNGEPCVVECHRPIEFEESPWITF